MKYNINMQKDQWRLIVPALREYFKHFKIIIQTIATNTQLRSSTRVKVVISHFKKYFVTIKSPAFKGTEVLSAKYKQYYWIVITDM